MKGGIDEFPVSIAFGKGGLIDSGQAFLKVRSMGVSCSKGAAPWVDKCIDFLLEKRYRRS
jgi:hypothetical protein